MRSFLESNQTEKLTKLNVNRTNEREPHPPKGGTKMGGGLKGTFLLRGLVSEAMEQLERFVQLQQDEDICLQGGALYW